MQLPVLSALRSTFVIKCIFSDDFFVFPIDFDNERDITKGNLCCQSVLQLTAATARKKHDRVEGLKLKRYDLILKSCKASMIKCKRMTSQTKLR